MTINVSEKIEAGTWIGTYHVKDEKVQTRFKVTGDTEEECFKKIYPSERSLRYCNGYFIELDDPELNKRYIEWKKHGVTIEMFYGNGTVD